MHVPHPTHAMKKVCLMILTLALLLTVGMFSVAMAAEDQVDVVMELSKSVFTGPEEITVTIRVTNVSDKDMPGPLALYYPSGQMIKDFGTPTLTAGQSLTWTGTWAVTQDQIDAGRVVFAMMHTIEGENGKLTKKQTDWFAPISSADAVAQVTIERWIVPSMAGKGQKVSVIYEVSNVGTVDVTDVVIRESSTISKSTGKIDSVKAGEKKTHTFTVTMGTKNLTSNANITYKAGGREYTESIGNATIKYGTVKLSASVKADKKGGNIGDTVKLTLTLKNSGKSDYQNITVSDPSLGAIFSGLTVKAGETVTKEKELTISKSGSYQFTVAGTDASGNTVETATDRITVTAVDPAQAARLNVSLSADNDKLYTLPDVVTFTVQVTNYGLSEAKDVTVSASGVDLYTFDSIKAGETKTFKRDVMVEMTGSFRFDARTKDQLGETVVFQSNVVRISKVRPEATPTMVPIPAPQMPELEELPTDDGLPPYVDTLQSGLVIARYVALGIGAAAVLLIVIGAASRVAKAAKSGKAADHLERDGYRSYVEAVPAKDRHVMPESDEEDATEAPAEEASAEEPAAEEAAPAEEEDAAIVTDATAELYPHAEGNEAPTYQRRRRNTEEE